MHIGVSVERDHLRAVGVRRGRVLWGVECAVDAVRPLDDVLAEFLVSLPVRGWWRPPVTAALGGFFAQTKRLVGLPPLTDAHLLAQTVHEHTGRFFLKNGVPLVTTSVRVVEPGAVWAAALDRTVIAAIETGCRAARLRLHGVVPAADVVSRGLVTPEHGAILWDEPGARAILSWSDGRLSTVTRAPLTSPVAPLTDAPLTVTPALATLGVDAWRFAPAYGAALAAGSRSATLEWRGASAPDITIPRRRLALAVGSVSVLALLALLAPGLAARRAERRAVAHLVAVGAAQGAAQRTQRNVAQVTTALGEMATFSAGGRSMTRTLAALARALPVGAALVAMHADSAGGSLVALTPRAGELLARIETVPGLISPEVVSPVTRETIAGRELERATIKFRWKQP